MYEVRFDFFNKIIYIYQGRIQVFSTVEHNKIVSDEFCIYLRPHHGWGRREEILNFLHAETPKITVSCSILMKIEMPNHDK